MRSLVSADGKSGLTMVQGNFRFRAFSQIDLMGKSRLYMKQVRDEDTWICFYSRLSCLPFLSLCVCVCGRGGGGGGGGVGGASID